jgi:starch phosphorylase
MEASGTSGQKAALNGCLNFSVLDGWWCEGYNTKNGWIIGLQEKLEYRDDEEQDLIDSKSLYKTLEEKIVPLYYNTTEDGTPWKWVNWMKESIISNAPKYSTDRMVQEYVRRLYMPAVDRGIKMRRNDYQQAKELAAWKERIRSNWQEIEITSENEGEQGNFNMTDTIELSTKIKLNGLAPDDIEVEVYIIIENSPEEVEIVKMNKREELGDNTFGYFAEINLEETGVYKYTFRVIPTQSNLVTKHELGLIKWIQ